MDFCNWSPKIHTTTKNQLRVYYTTHRNLVIAKFMAEREMRSHALDLILKE